MSEKFLFVSFLYLCIPFHVYPWPVLGRIAWSMEILQFKFLTEVTMTLLEAYQAGLLQNVTVVGMGSKKKLHGSITSCFIYCNFSQF